MPRISAKLRDSGEVHFLVGELTRLAFGSELTRLALGSEPTLLATYWPHSDFGGRSSWCGMNAGRPDYPLDVWDRQWWTYLDVLGGAKRDEVPNAADVYDRLVQYAFASDIDWECVLRADSLEDAKRGLAALFERMARELTTPEQLKGLLTSMNSAAEQKGATGKFREATGTAGEILENRALGRSGARPLPRGWQDVLAPFADTSSQAGGDYWARRILAAARHASRPDPAH